MQDAPSRPGRRTLLRYGAVAAIVLVIAGLLVQREFLGGDEELGVLDTHRPEVGRAAPDFALESPEGETVRLSDFRGRTVVLNFWATWCVPCREEMPDFEAVWRERGGADGDLAVLAVNVQESASQAVAFLDEFAITFPVALDSSGAVTDHYGLRGLPGTFFIDRDGVIRRQVIGPAQGDLLREGIAAADAGAP